MVGEINFGLLNTNLPEQIAQGYERGRQNRLAELSQRQQLQMGGINLSNAQRAQADEATMREAAQQSGGDLDAYGTALLKKGMMKPYQQLQADKLDRQKKQGDIQHTQAQTTKLDLEFHNQAGRNMADNPSDENILGWVKKSVDLKLHTPEEAQGLLQHALQMSTQERQQFFAGMGASAAEKLKQFTPEMSQVDTGAGVSFVDKNPRTNPLIGTTEIPKSLSPMDSINAANKPFGVGPGGQAIPNIPVQKFEIGKARAGSSNINIPISTEKKYGEQFAGKIAEADSLLRDIAGKAPDLADRAIRIKETLKKGVITGFGADARLTLGKALGLVGASDKETIVNTETLAAQLAQNTMDSIKATGLGGGTGFSNADRDFLEKAVGGKITLDLGSIDRLATLAHKAATSSAGKWNKRVKEIPASSIQGTGIDTSPIEITPLESSMQNAPPAVKYDPNKERRYQEWKAKQGTR
jgi:hypothetical protein